MQLNWIVQVLEDLKRFSGDNGLPLLADQLEETLQLAEKEIAVSQDTETRVAWDGSKGQPSIGKIGSSANA